LLTKDGMILASSHLDGVSLQLKFIGVNPAVDIRAQDELPGHSNYYYGANPSRWRSAVPHFSRIRYFGLYPGIDLVDYGTRTNLEHDFLVFPGADPKRMLLKLTGVDATLVDAQGSLD